MEMLEDLSDVDLLVVLDIMTSGEAPGRDAWRIGNEMPVFFRRKLSPHQISICDVLASLEFSGHAPRDLVLVGIEPHSLDLGLELTPAVAGRVPAMVDMAVAQLAQRGIRLDPRTPRPGPNDPVM